MASSDHQGNVAAPGRGRRCWRRRAAPYTDGLRRAVKHFDDAVDHAFHQLRGRPTADAMFYFASEAADFSLAWHVIGGTMALVSPARRPHSIRLAAALGLESIVVNGVIKRFTSRQRPPLLDDPAYKVRRPKTKSFPSGHASSATLAAILLSDAMPRLRPLWIASAAIVAASRVHNRMHHGSDVVAGTVLGTVFGIATKRIRPLR